MKRIFTAFIIMLFLINANASVTVYAPTLIAPAESAQNQAINVLLNWSPVAGAMSYRIWVDTDSLFSSPIVLNSVYSAKETDQLLFNTQYFWKVLAVGTSANDTSDWSLTRTFFTKAYPDMLTPLDSAVNQSPKTILRWKAMLGVKHYEVICDTTPQFNSPLLIQKDVDLSLTPHIAQMQGTTLLYYYSETEVSHLLFNTEYYWAVRARHDNDTSEYSSPYMFKVLDTLILTTPANLATGVVPNVELKWQTITGATKYEVNVDTTETFDSPIAYTVYPVNNFVFADTLNFGYTYFWRVRAIHTLDTSIYSVTNNFIVLERPTLTSPNDNATLVSVHPTLKWQAITGVTEFDILIADNPAFNAPMMFTTAGNVSEIFVNNFTLSLNTTYYWKVKTMHSRDTSDWSASRSFSTGNTSIYDVQLTNNFNIFPNPATENISIEINSELNTNATLTIIDITGRTVYSDIKLLNKGQNTFNINLSFLNQGIYIISLKNDNINLNKKLILNN